MGGPEWPPHHYHPVRQGGGVETDLTGGGGDEGDHGEGLSGLCQTAKLVNLIQVTGSDHDGIRRLLAGGGGEPT